MGGIISSLLGDGVEAAGTGIGAILGGVGTLAKDIRSAITGEITSEKKAEIEAKILELSNSVMIAQTQINLEEAKNSSLFVSGWRPATGWVGVIALAYKFIIRDITNIILVAFGTDFIMPELDVLDLIFILTGMLGLSGMRSLEKLKGVSRS